MPRIPNGEQILQESGHAIGWLYLAASVDIYSRLVIGWARSKERDEQLVIKAAKLAITQRRPEVGLVHHSDRGSQYTSQGYLAVLKAAEIHVSMSNKGDWYDNALMESFFGTCDARNASSVKAIKHEQKQGVLCLNISKCFTIDNEDIPP